MNHQARFPVFAQDAEIFKRLSKRACAGIASAAGLDKDFDPLFRHSDQTLAKGFGSTSFNRLFEEVAGTPPVVEPYLERKSIVQRFAAALELAIARLAQEVTFSGEQLASMKKALPAILLDVANELKQLKVDEFTIERVFLDPALVAAGAPKYEFAISDDYKARIFIFDDARAALLKAAGQASPEAIGRVPAQQIREILRTCTFPLEDAVKQQRLPLTHKPVVLADQENKVVGVSFQHPVHLGIVPVCCEGLERFWAVMAALYVPTQAQTRHGSNWALGHVDPAKIIPFFSSMFTREKQRRDAPLVYFKQVSLERAIEYLTALEKAVNGERVTCQESDVQELRGATLSYVDLGSPATGTTRRYWGLVSIQDEHGPSAIMSASGTMHRGIMSEHQWYLRQHIWLDEAGLPELDMSSGNFMATRPVLDNGSTKIIPDETDAFLARAHARLNQMARSHEHDEAVRIARAKLKKEESLIKKIRASLQAEDDARVEARSARVAAVGAVVPSAG